MESTSAATTMDKSVTITEDNARQSSKLSLGSSPSALSADEQLDGEGPLTPTDKMQDDVEDDDDDLSALNSILQAGSPGSLSDEEEDDDDEEDEEEEEGDDEQGDADEEEEEEEEDDDDLHTEQDSASPLSSVPDDFPLSRSASPELPLVAELAREEEADGEDEEDDTNTKKQATDQEDEEDEEDEEGEEEEEEQHQVDSKKPLNNTTNSRKRRMETNKKSNDTKKESDTEHEPSPAKKAKQSSDSTPLEDNKLTDTSSSEDTLIGKNKRRRVSRTTLEITEVPRTRRRQSRQEEPIIKRETEEVTEEVQVATATKDASSEPLSTDSKSEQNDTPTDVGDDSTDKEMNHASEKPGKLQQEPIISQQGPQEEAETNGEGESEEQQSGNHDAQDNDDYDYQQRHKEALDALTHIEVEFARLRDKMYQEKMSELNEEAIMIANGTHPELVALMAEIEERKGRRIHSAEAWRRYQHANFKRQFEGFEYQANIHFISQKNALRRNLLNSINGKRWDMEDERTKLSDPARGERVFPDGHELVVHKREQKEETGELQDIKEAVGFPMAPSPSGLNTQDVDDDLKLLGIKHSTVCL